MLEKCVDMYTLLGKAFRKDSERKVWISQLIWNLEGMIPIFAGATLFPTMHRLQSGFCLDILGIFCNFSWQFIPFLLVVLINTVSGQFIL